MLQNTRVTASTASESLRENQQGGGGGVNILPSPPRLGLRNLQAIIYCMKVIKPVWQWTLLCTFSCYD